MFLKQIYRLFLVVFLVTAGMTGMGSATILDYEFDIEIDVTDESNPYGFALGDNSVQMAITIDTEQGHISDFYSMHSKSNDTSFSMDLIFGTTTHNLNDDVWYEPSGTQWPLATFNTTEWSIDNISFEIEDSDKSSWIKIGVENLKDPLTLAAGSGSLEAPTSEWSTSGTFPEDIRPIPEPTTLALFTIGLLGLAGISRRFRP